MMKKLIYILLFLPLYVFPTNYYVKNGGSDAANGLTDGTAWATISKVSGFAFSAGDTIFFARGSVWRMTTASGYLQCKSGSLAGGHVVYTNYGTGDLPLFIGAKEENSEEDWDYQGSNLWRNSDPTFITEVGNIVLNSGESYGIRVNTIGEVNAQSRWFYDFTNKNVTMYSTENPATLYTDIECVLTVNPGLIYVRGDYHHITIDGLAMLYSARHGILIASGANNIVIRNCWISTMGGAKTSSTSSTRLGNGIEFWSNHRDILCEQNYIEECLDAGISTQYYDDDNVVGISNIIMRYNVIKNCEFSFEMIYACSSGEVDKVFFENNTCLNAGMCWSHNQRWSVAKGYHVSSSAGNNATITNYYIRNNIFVNATQGGGKHQQTWPVTKLIWDYNSYYNCPVIQLVSITNYLTLAQWQAYSSHDTHSLDSDPLINTDYTLQSESPAIDAGADLGYTYDYLSQEVPNGSAPDIGAIERYDEDPPIEPVIVTTIRPYWTSESTAVAGGSVTSTGGGTVSVRGVCWNTTGTPTTSDSKTEDGSGTGAYISLMTGLNNTLTYYVRAYAVNEAGTSYGEELLFRKGILLIDPDTGKPLVKDNKFITR